MNPMVSKGNNKNIIAIAVVVLLVLLVIGLILWFTLGNESNNDKKEKFGNNNPFEKTCCDAKYVMRPRRVRRPNGGLDRRYFEALEANCNNNGRLRRSFLFNGRNCPPTPQ